jgi:ribosomal protein L37AE/L43A
MKQNAANHTCFECKSENPEWASANNGIMLCKGCGEKHKALGNSVSLVRSILLDMWT